MVRGKSVFISGAIQNDPNYKEKFAHAKDAILKRGAAQVVNPAEFPDDLTEKQCLVACMSILPTIDLVVLLRDWNTSNGSTAEAIYSNRLGKRVIEIDSIVPDLYTPANTIDG